MGETTGFSPVGGGGRLGGGFIVQFVSSATSALAFVFFFILFATGILVNHYVDVPALRGRFLQKDILPVNASFLNNSVIETCPEYFRWIHEDLKPWKLTGITKEMVEKAKEVAHFRLIIIDGRVYMEKYDYVYQTRDVFTVWGILQLLKLYPGKLPDLELVFQCHDPPGIPKSVYNDNASFVPPLFHYCGDDSTFDIVFPDWSFWGWPELNIMPWEVLAEELEEGNKRIKWEERQPYAYWKGNLRTGGRKDLARCNPTDEHDWNARIHHLDWRNEQRKGFNNTKLADQCTHRYKIYIEGNAWSVSEKYILACDSMSLLIDPHFYDFFTRSLVPTVHYWPINPHNKCDSIKFAVDWGNNNAEKAQQIGEAGSRFIRDEVKMKYVYDYMFHLLSEYGKLFRYKPIITRNAIEVCSCMDKGLVKKCKELSMVNGPSDTSPCTMLPPYDPRDLQAFLEKKLSLTKQVKSWEASGRVDEVHIP